MRRIIAIIMIVGVTICVGCGTKRPAVDIEAQLLEADRLFLEGNYEEVILTLETVLEVEPATVRGYLRLSDAYIARGEEDKALELLQRGLDLTGDEEIAARIQGMTEEINGVVDVSNNLNTTLILTENDELYYCGIADYWDEEENSTVPKRIEGASNVKELMVQPFGCYYITNDNELYGWGFCMTPLDFDYRDGDLDYRRPHKITDNVASISCNVGGGLLLFTDGTLYSWGNNEDGELGRGLPFNEEWSVNWSSQTEYYDDYMGVVMHDVINMNYAENNTHAQACAVTSDGSLYVWGEMDDIEENGERVKVCYNTPQKIADNMAKAAIYEQGILGLDKDNNLVKVNWESPGLSNVDKFSIIKDIKEFECTTDYYIALGMDGIVYTGGNNNLAGQMGGAPNPIGNTKATAISAGGEPLIGSTFAVTEQGKLLAWGNNEVGQLGNGRSGMQRDAEQRHLILSGVREVFADYGNTAYAIMENGDLYSWGGSEQRKTPSKVLENVKVVSQDSRGPLALMTDGKVSLYSALFGNFNDIKDIHVLHGSYFAICENGELWGWGDNYNCLLGIGKKTDISITEDQTIHEPLLLMEDVEDVTGTTFFLKKNGDVFFCGSHYPEDILTPVKIASNMTKIFESEETGVYMQGEDGKLYYFDSYETETTELVDIPIGVSDISSTGWGLFIDDKNNLYEIILATDEEDWEGRNKEQYSLFREWRHYGGYYYRKICDDAISCANQHKTFYYVSSTGDLYSWGSNDYGLLGIGDARQDENIFEVKLPQ